MRGPLVDQRGNGLLLEGQRAARALQYRGKTGIFARQWTMHSCAQNMPAYGTSGDYQPEVPPTSGARHFL